MKTTEYNQQIERLRKKLKREIRAREEAEQLLEEKAEELYQAANTHKSWSRPWTQRRMGLH